MLSFVYMNFISRTVEICKYFAGPEPGGGGSELPNDPPQPLREVIFSSPVIEGSAI